MADSSAQRRIHRQLTIGECLAISRYGSGELDERPMTMGEILDLIDRLEVCTTCGWSVHMHMQAGVEARSIGLCAHYSREL